MQHLSMKNTYVYMAMVVLIFLVVATVHYINGRNFICTCGYVKLFNTQVASDDSQHVFDWYTFSHIAHGILFYGFLHLVSKIKKIPLRWRYLIALFVEAAWELGENSPAIIRHYQETTISTTYEGDSIINSLSDIFAMSIGFILSSKLPTWSIVILLITMEVGVGYLIRDNLTLNILMLIYPAPAIRSWQMGM